MKIEFSKIVYKILDSVFNALSDCVLISGITFEKKNEDWAYTKENFSKINRHFEWLREKPYYSYNSSPDRHLIIGIDSKNEFNGFSRAAQLTVNAFLESQEETKRKGFTGLIIPSPLYVLYNILTVPSQLQSSGYSLVICRDILFGQIQAANGAKIRDLLGFENIRDAIETFQNYYNKRDNVPVSIDTPALLLTAHFLAMKGMMFLRFPDFKNTKSRKKRPTEQVKEDSEITDIQKFLNGKQLWVNKKITYEFRLSLNYTGLPDASEIINQLKGMPLPIRGAETIFYGGLKKSADNSLVISLSGEPGIGKTTFALAMGTLLSPFGTDCLYLTTEEKPIDLEDKLLNVTPSYLKRLSIYRKTKEWFFPVELDLDIETNFSNLIDLLADLKSESTEGDVDEIDDGIFSSLIVIDNITRLINENKRSYGIEMLSESEGFGENDLYENLEQFIKTCKKQQAIVVLISAEEAIANTPIEYLVDISIRLVHQNTGNIIEKPSRELHLIKSRHQLSRPGAHLFHLSGFKGVRISPQIPSQMDRKEKTRKHLPDYDRVINTLNFINAKQSKKLPPSYNRFLNIFQNSHILIHGHGSSGKAGLALKILLAPVCNPKFFGEDKGVSEQEIDFSSLKYSRKILIISFLYSSEYYNYLLANLSSQNRLIYKNLGDPEVEYIQFYPGYLKPEDLVHKISRFLEEAISFGKPYSGILLDGLHNVFLQFPNLQERGMMWPMLYSLLGRYNLTVVSTFTNFAINQPGNIYEYASYEDQQLRREGQEPFLHALVQSADFYFIVEPQKPSNNEHIRTYYLHVVGAINQPVPLNPIVWDRENLLLVES